MLKTGVINFLISNLILQNIFNGIYIHVVIIDQVVIVNK